MENPDLTTVNQPTMPPPVAPPVGAPRPRLNLWPIAAVVVVTGIFVLVAVTATSAVKGRQSRESPAATLMPTPSPMRNLSPLATQSAFLQLVAGAASLSASLNSYSPQDPSLSPPTLDLPLGLP